MVHTVDGEVVRDVVVVDVDHRVSAELPAVSDRTRARVPGRRVPVQTLVGDEEQARARKPRRDLVRRVGTVVAKGRRATRRPGRRPLLEHLYLEVMEVAVDTSVG